MPRFLGRLSQLQEFTEDGERPGFVTTGENVQSGGPSFWPRVDGEMTLGQNDKGRHSVWLEVGST